MEFLSQGSWSNQILPIVREISSAISEIEAVAATASTDKKAIYHERSNMFENIRKAVEPFRRLDGVGAANSLDPVRNKLSELRDRLRDTKAAIENEPLTTALGKLEPGYYEPVLTELSRLSQPIFSPMALANIVQQLDEVPDKIQQAFVDNTEALKRKVDDAVADSMEKMIEVNGILEEISKLEGVLRGLLQENEGKKYNGLFTKEAKFHRAMAIGAGVSGLFVLGATVFLTSHYIGKATLAGRLDPTQLLPYSPITAALLLISIILLKFLIAERHNWIINSQKAVAMESLEAFALTIEDKEMRKAISLQIAATIFTLPPTGYSKLPIEVTSPIVKLAERE